jgi:predicted kinase
LPPVLILSGPPASGKTTVAGLIADRFERSVHLESDTFFHFIKGGYIDPWRPESHEQNAAVMRIVSDAASGYASSGYLTIIDGIVIPGWFFQPMRTALREHGLDVAYAVLRPSRTATADRSRRRSSGLTDPAVLDRLWDAFEHLGPLERFVIDNADQEPEETADLLTERLRLGSLTT